MRNPIAPWQERSLPSRFTLDETLAMVRRYEWWERFLFELMGGWVETVEEIDVKFKLGTQCYHHAWHAELWQNRLGQVGATMGADSTSAIETAPDALLPLAETLASTGGTIERLTGLYRVIIPQLNARYFYHSNNTSKVTDGPTVRVLDLCLSDTVKDWSEGEMVLESLLVGPAEIDRSAKQQAEVSKIVLSAGGLMP